MAKGMAAADGDEVTFWAAHLPGNVASVPTARRFTLDALHALGQDGADEVAALLVSEVATNAVLHARSPMRLSVWCHDGHPRVEVRDDDPTPPREVVADPMACGGRGMVLVDALASAWGVNRNGRGKTVWFEL
jgi:anti-sigma regulatory factor (Ser/Thr protein kinase)